MEHLDFILWMVLFPIAISLSGYIDEKKYKISGKRKQYSDSAESLSALVYVILWFGIGANLF